MEFTECKIFKAITELPFHKVAQKVAELLDEKCDLRIKNCTGGTFLHAAVDFPEKFNDPRALPAIYALCLSGIDVNAQDGDGDTALHKAVRREGVWRIVIALLR